MGKNTNTVNKVVTYIVIVLLLVAFAGGLGALLVKKEGVSFYIKNNTEKYFANVDNGYVKLVPKKSYQFDVKTIKPKNFDYTVRILPNKANDFKFSINGEEKYFSETGDYSKIFNVNKQKDNFTITTPESLKNAIEVQTNQVVEDDVLPTDNIFVIEIKSTNSKGVVYIYLSMYQGITSVTLDKTSIVI